MTTSKFQNANSQLGVVVLGDWELGIGSWQLKTGSV